MEKCNSERYFISAKPVWPEEMESVMNVTAGFRAVVKVENEDENIVLHIAAATIYRVFINGKFVCHGPARGPHDYYRVDEWNISRYITRGSNIIAIEVASYNANSFYLLDQPAFLQAEVVSKDRALASTAGDGANFEAALLKERLQKVQRYSFQRPFSEVYRLKPGYDTWRIDAVRLAVQPEKKLIPRRVPCPEFLLRYPVKETSAGKFDMNATVEQIWKDRGLVSIGPDLKGYKEDEIEVLPSIELQKARNISKEELNKPVTGEFNIKLTDKSWHIFDFGTNLSGFIGIKINCKKQTKMDITFDEILEDGDVNFMRLGCVNIIRIELEKGRYSFESAEPYTLQFLKLMVHEGECEVEEVYLREYANPDVHRASFKCSDTRLGKLFTAGIETFRQNAIDIYMDCPSRERAGWLCDSFFTSRVEYDLTGKSLIEKNFFENFLLPEKFKFMPEGMLPMCYPSDVNDGVFIPNWAMWFVVELEEYLMRSGDTDLVNGLKTRVYKLLEYFKRFENEYGLLEKLESWIFIEWSKAADFVQDVSYPSNMLYAGVLAAAGRIYGDGELVQKSEKLKKTIREHSFNGKFFVDNAVRSDGKLVTTNNTTEVCQYYAFFFGIATPETYKELWNTLIDEFGPHRKETGAYPEVYKANAFIGNYLRLEILSRYGLVSKLVEETVGYLLYMAELTGTIWENDTAYASCNHGFASHIIHILYRDMLGLYRIDQQNKVIKLRFCDTALKQCEGKVPAGDNYVSLNWWEDSGCIYFKLDIPADYTVEVTNLSGKKLTQVAG